MRERPTFLAPLAFVAALLMIVSAVAGCGDDADDRDAALERAETVASGGAGTASKQDPTAAEIEQLTEDSATAGVQAGLSPVPPNPSSGRPPNARRANGAGKPIATASKRRKKRKKRRRRPPPAAAQPPATDNVAAAALSLAINYAKWKVQTSPSDPYTYDWQIYTDDCVMTSSENGRCLVYFWQQELAWGPGGANRGIYREYFHARRYAPGKYSTRIDFIDYLYPYYYICTSYGSATIPRCGSNGPWY